ncbi:TIGR03617 family F420-dependent LLM class oxidoreductase [Actinophytocola algeriensis]|uniref:Putative F420-dependent oxidoreductase n=1 Tax=Actinophytocola algeriensis TaxID=1768010 RepID=A0A7W7Q1C9_9PSEU|nr:TIGR03617 family F420-dependent LLM class oxidoreductase [Actinophytocola algeriensis]MBB4905151.1 putative F420-dependent oxidoreductase [Actinophytocola algeriensis]MBE1473164.1 putative F420-dependent oxidoreductase [Actinophytocola algeriensis]
MLVDGNIGGVVDGTAGGDLQEIEAQVAQALRIGLDGVWTTETSRDPFLPLLLAARRAPELTVGTAVAVAFARNPMTLAVTANDLHAMSGGRFVLGLGSQVSAHITRRFSMPWSAPAARMREFVLALRAIWASWQTGDRLHFTGEFYSHTLMPPLFRPGPNPHGPPPVVLAAVGPRMTRVAAEVADGLLVHSLTSERYLREVTLPPLAGRGPGFTVCHPGLVATGAGEQEFVTAVAEVRKQVAFYAATPAYRAVLDLHGWGDLHTELHRLSRRGDWGTMTGLVDDTVLGTFAVVGEPAAAGAEIARRYSGLVDRFTMYTPYPLAEQTRAAVVSAVRAGVGAQAGAGCFTG